MASMSQFKVGDVVRLKSGGPRMTIVSLKAGMTSDHRCSWFEGAQPKDGHFPPEALEPAEKDD